MLLGIPRSARCVQRFDDSLKICNSHYLSHFAAFFIDARAKRSVVESCINFFTERFLGRRYRFYILRHTSVYDKAWDGVHHRRAPRLVHRGWFGLKGGDVHMPQRASTAKAL